MNMFVTHAIALIAGLLMGAVFGAFWGRKHPKLVSIAAAAAEQAKKAP
jgi:hypothetical protein